MSNVWVYIEHSKGTLRDTSIELMGEGRRIADKLACQLEAILLGSQVQNLVNEIGFYKVDKIYLSDDPSYTDYLPEMYCHTIHALITQQSPSLIFFGATSYGSDLAARLAAKTRAQLITGYIDSDLDDENRFVITRSTYGGQLYAAVQPQADRLSIVTIKPGLLGFDKPVPGYTTEVVNIPAATDAVKKSITVGRSIKADPQSVDLSEADFVVGVGAGLHSREQYKLAEELARALNASLGGTRKVRDFGWIDPGRVIGQSGKYISPGLYIAVGVSGAIHHTVGIRDSKYIVSINIDRGAPIIEMSDLALIGDCHQIVPVILSKLKKSDGNK